MKAISKFFQIRPKYQWTFVRLKNAVAGVYVRRREISSQELEGKFIFIVGCGRSGNTLLRRLLMKQFSIYIPPETYVLPNQIIRYHQLPTKSWHDKVDAVLSALEYHSEFATFEITSLACFAYEAKKWPEEKRNFFTLIDGLYRWIGHQSGWQAEWIGDKTPLNTMSLGVIRGSFPNAKFIYLERDPVDAIYSYLNSGIYTDASEAATRWVKSTAAWENFKSIHGERKCFEIQYEKLVADPSSYIEAIGTVFGLPRSTSASRSSDFRMGDVEFYSHHANSVNPPSMSSIGKGRANMSEEKLSEIRPVIGGYAEKRGYAAV